MAAAAIPLAISALGSLGPLIGKLGGVLINLAEAFLPKGTKMPMVVTTLQGFLNALGTSGQLPQNAPLALPTAVQIEQIMEGVLASMKATGMLVAPLSGLVPDPIAPGGGAPTFTVTPPPASSILKSMQTARAVLDSLILSANSFSTKGA